MHYEVRCNSTGELTGFFTSLNAAKIKAEDLCNDSGRKKHFTVVEMKDVWVTSTLDEILKR